MDPKEQCCGNCHAYLPHNNISGECRANPPTPLFLGMSQSVTILDQKTRPQPIVNGFFPRVDKTIWCRTWRPKFEDVQINVQIIDDWQPKPGDEQS